MNKIQRYQLEMAIKVDEICNKYKIKYFIEGGTLIGAVRHKGFIPWDDDLDINMLRKDYEKFIKVAQKELGDKYFLQTTDTDKNYGYCYAKIRANNTTYVEKVSKNVKINNGIFIDIFPIDNYNNNLYGRLLMIYNYYLKFLLLAKNGYIAPKFIYNLIYIFIRFNSLFYKKEKIIYKLNKVQTTFNNDETLYYTNWNDFKYLNWFFDKEIYNESSLYKFENYMLKGPKNYDTYLTEYFGDYMTPPSVNKRENIHDIIECNENNS